MHEVELIQVAYRVAKTFEPYIGNKYLIMISNSEIIDAILDECLVPIEQRHLVINTVYQMKKAHKFIPEITLHLKQNNLIAGPQLQKFKELIKI